MNEKYIFLFISVIYGFPFFLSLNTERTGEQRDVCKHFDDDCKYPLNESGKTLFDRYQAKKNRPHLFLHH